MSICVKFKRFKTLKAKHPKYARLEFRGEYQFSSIKTQCGEYLEINERFDWDIGTTPINPGETLVVDLMMRTRWSTERCMGTYRLGLQHVVEYCFAQICDSLLSDEDNKPVKVFIEFGVFYDKIGESPGTAERIAGDTVCAAYAMIPTKRTSNQARKNKYKPPLTSKYQTDTSPQPMIHQRATIPKRAPNQSWTCTPPEQFEPLVIIKQSSRKEPMSPQTQASTSRKESMSPPTQASSSSSTFHQALAMKYTQSVSKPQPTTPQAPNQNSQQTSRHTSPISPQSSAPHSEGDDTDPLINVERNIACLEKSLKNKDTLIEIESGDEIANRDSRGFKLKNVGKSIFRRTWSFGETSADRNARTVTKDELPTHKPKKTSAFRSVKNIMRMSKSKYSDSSCDEEIGLLDTATGGARISSAYDGSSQASMSSDDDAELTEIRVIKSTDPGIPKPPQKMKNLIGMAGPAALKAADFQVCVTVIEARQLAGLNMDPVVGVQVGDSRRFTSVKVGTNCPYYNEYFVFDFHMPPVMLLDKIITLSVQQSRNYFLSKKLLGSFKLDVATVWNQPDRQFYHKWALLTDPDDVGSGPKGYLKCDISVIGKGDQIKVPPKSEKDEDDIEANLLLPDGMPTDRQRARYIVKIHKADGLPKMNYSLMANMKKAITGESQDLADPFVEVSYAGMTGQTSVCKNSYSPVWNEQIMFHDMFPPLCQRIKIQLKDQDPTQMKSTIIGTHFVDIGKISNDGERGFLPTFGPTYVHLYGSTRDFSLIDQYASLNDGMGEGVSYRGRILISIRTEIMEILDCPQSTEVEVEDIPPIIDSSLGKNLEFFTFCSIHEAAMINKRFTDKPLSFELSLGNSGNTLDGNIEAKKPRDLLVEDLDELKVDSGYWQSTTPPSKATSLDKTYYYLPIWDQKQCMQIRSVWPDHRRRMYNSNIIGNIIEKFEEGLADAEVCMNTDVDDGAVQTMKATMEAASNACSAYVRHMTNAPPLGSTTLDRERQKLCLHELEKLAVLTKNLKVIITKHSLKDRLRTAHTYLDQLRHLCEDSQQSMPDVFIWLISNSKRLAYHRVPAREIIYSDVPDETGKYCAKMQTVFLKWPGKRASYPSGWSIPAKICVYLWLGTIHDKGHYIDGLPPGYELGNELRNAATRHSNAPTHIYYAERHKFQMRGYVYQARSLIGSDASGLSDPFARIIICDISQSTQVIDQTLSPTWDETLVFNDVTLYSTIENIKADPPTVVIEIFDQDSVGKAEFIGRTLAKPHIRSLEDIRDMPSCLPALEWHHISRGEDMAGELLATFELLEVIDAEDTMSLPALPLPRSPTVLSGKTPVDMLNQGPILPVPRGIRPTLSKYRIEVLFWGLRDLKRVQFSTVEQPRVDIECSGNTLSSTIIQNAKRSANFLSPPRFIEVELPDQGIYQPPLTIRTVDCRSFGRDVLVGTHTINSIHKYIFTPMSRRERDIEDRKKSLIQLQNVDLRANRIIEADVYTIENEKESMPLLPRKPFMHKSKGARPHPRPGHVELDLQASRKLKASSESNLNNEDDVGRIDWWTKYFASYEVMIEDMKEKHKEQVNTPGASGTLSQQSSRDDGRAPENERAGGGARRKVPHSPKGKGKKQRIEFENNAATTLKQDQIPKSSLTTVYPHELEAVPELEEFSEWLHSFELYRGKKTGDDLDDDSRVVGTFKGAIKVYKWPLPKGIDDHTVMGFDPKYGFFQGIPNNEPIHVLVRVYIVKATDLHPMDLNGKADPYIVLHLGNRKITADKDHYVSKQLNPVFGKCFEIEATFPQDSILTVGVTDWDLVGRDDLIGETKIDLENRFYSRHRATCGLPQKYEESGYNRWHDSLKPTQILAKLCKDGKLDPPVYEQTRVKVGRTIFNMPLDDAEFYSNPDTIDEQMALVVLRRWQEVPRVGCNLVKEHVETRSLYNPKKPGIEQGRLEMWVEMFPMDMPAPPPQLDISPRKPKAYEMRVIIWNTDDVVLEDDAFFTGEKMSDIYVKGWLKGPDDCQSTDVHYRSLTGEGNFNWRFIFPFEYLEAEERIVISRKESMFSWDETECKIPARLELQVWDSDHFSSDDFLGAITLDLNRMPRGAKSAKHCTLDMLCADGAVPIINIFKLRRIRAWWPFHIKHNNEEMILTGKLEAEILLLTKEEAERMPAGFGRSEPDALDKPNRPDASFMWFLNPLKSARYILWHNFKWKIVTYSSLVFGIIMIMTGLIAFPEYTVKRLLGA